MTTYKEAGVNIDAADQMLDRIKPLIRRTFTPQVIADVGAFGGFFDISESGVERPVLVSSIDGVGTKLKVAFLTGIHDTVGRDLVNHCVNDIAVCGAKPLFFLDYFAVGRLDPDVGEAVVSGIASACRENGCALIGGETAEMPGLYGAGEYDLAGTVVGVVDRNAILDGSRVQEGDKLLGLRSSGLHSNGYSLARKVLLDRSGHDHAPPELGGLTIGAELLQVHRSYLPFIRQLHEMDLAHAFAHITGGGLGGNVGRVVPDGLAAHIDYDSWARGNVFNLIQAWGRVPESDMRRTFNLGIGLVAIVAADAVDEVRRVLSKMGEESRVIGDIRAGDSE